MRNSGKNSPRNGATIILMMIMLVVVFIFVAFAIDVGRIQLAQLKLQTASDFAARAGAEAMSRGVGDVNDLAALESAVRAEADMLMQENSLFGFPVSFDSNAQIQFAVATPIENSGAPAFAGNGNGKGKGNGPSRNPHHGNGKDKFNVAMIGGGSSLTSQSNTVRVTPDISQFPLVFGNFLGQDSVALFTESSARIQTRDIVVVIDRSTSMFDHDAGMMPVAEYNANLLAVEDALYDSTDSFFTTDPSQSIRHSEFEINGGIINLSRTQALKLAVLKFREQIDLTRGREKLGLITYGSTSDSPSTVTVSTPNSAVDIIAGLTPTEIAAITAPVDDSTAAAASALEDDTNNYRNFDFHYLRARCKSSTNIADGITKGTETLFGTGRRSTATPILIVMTDGRHNQESTPETAATAARAAHPEILIYTITFGDGAEIAPMENVANIGGGKHFHANNVDDLITVFEDLATNAGVTVVE